MTGRVITAAMKTIALVLGLACVLPVYGLDYGMCEADVSSKAYLNNVFMDPYPKTVEFKCLYNCMTDDGVQQVWGSHAVTIANETQDATGTVCQGAKVKRAPWGWDMDGVESFYAFEANTTEVLVFARQNISRDNPKELQLLSELQKTVYEVGQTYLMIGAQEAHSYYREAAIEMYQAVAGLPQDTSHLDAAIERIKSDKNVYPQTSKEFIFYNFIKSAAKFRF